MKRLLQCVFLCSIAVLPAIAWGQTAKKYALLFGVTKYQHARMNDNPLKFPEDDATAVADILKKSGYEVDLMVGAQVSRSAVEKALQKAGSQGTDGGAVLIGLFGHGVQYADFAYFCPHDAKVRVVKDSQGNVLRDDADRPRLEPDPNSLVPMSWILDALTQCGASNRIMMADCCRDDPSRARGRAFGTNLTNFDLPPQTIALFACSENEQAFESDDWKHGAFTYAFIENVEELSAKGPVNLGELQYKIVESVNKIVKEETKGAAKQTVTWVNSGPVDLLLASRKKDIKRPSPKPARKDIARTKTTTNSIGMEFTRIISGPFLMGSPDDEPTRDDDELQHEVEITKDFWLGTYEVTQGQWKDVMGTSPWLEENPRVKQAETMAATYISWEDAMEFCRKLSRREQVGYRLPTEAEWEYACRGGYGDAMFSFGNDVSDLRDYSWSSSSASFEPYAHEVGRKKPNPFGLYDIHGNVWEWCSDWYLADYYQRSPKKDPRGPSTGTTGVFRGGCFM